MDKTTIITTIAATLTTVSFLPQAIKTIHYKDTSGISFWMYFIFVTGVAFWISVGFLLNNYPIIIANIITFFLAGTVLFIKILSFRKK